MPYIELSINYRLTDNKVQHLIKILNLNRNYILNRKLTGMLLQIIFLLLLSDLKARFRFTTIRAIFKRCESGTFFE